MGDEPSRSPMMTRVCWWLVDSLSRALEPDECDAVRGDLAESGETGSRALRDVLGLLFRRQADLWRDWRPWLTLMGVIVPLGMLLSLVSRLRANESAVYVWMYANNWYWGLIRNRGFWHVLPESATVVFTIYLTLACWAWTAGFVLGAISRGMIRINGALLCLILLFGELVGAPRYLAYFFEYIHRVFPVQRVWHGNDPVSALMFYRVMFPLLVQAVVVALPALSGMRRGSEFWRLRPLLRTVLWTAAIASLAVMLLQAPGFGLLWLKAFGWPLMWNRWPTRLLQLFWRPHAAPLVVYWPVAYLVASAIARQWHRRMASV